MAAGDFSASEIQIAQVRVEQMFAAQNITTSQYNQPANTARAMLARQTSRTAQILANGQCVGVEAYWFKPSAATVSAPGSCATPTGTEGETAKQEYSNSVLARAAAKLEDNRCDNLTTFTEEYARQLQHCMAILRKTLNRSVVIPGISSATQANLYTFLPDSWDDTTNTPRIVVPEDDFAYSKLNQFSILAENNEFNEFFFVSGQLFNDDRWMADINRMNETERDRMAAWASNQIYFDTRDLDQVMTRKTAFAVDANSYLFWNTWRNTPTPVLKDAAENRYEFIVADPILRWNNDGVLTPVFYEFELQKTCLERGALEFRRYTYNLYGRLIGGFEFAPEGPNGETGVLQFAAE